MMWLQSYSCQTAAGDQVGDLWKALMEGRDNTRSWPKDPQLKAYMFHNRREGSVFDLLTDKLLLSFSQMRANLRLDETYGVIFASTKGMSEDFVWSREERPAARSARRPFEAHPADRDPLTPLLEEFLKRTELRPKRALCVSNACSSSLAALALSERWMREGISQVLIISADAVTPFVMKGFQALKLVSATGVKSFSGDRNGFFLGEAAACLLVTREQRNSTLKVHPVGLDSEGSPVTRPTSSGASLRQAALRIPGLLENRPDILVAHGTGTVINDETEDLAFSTLFADGKMPVITGTKWCVGHTLAASGAIDVIASAEALHAQQIFRLENTETPDARFRGFYLVKGAETPKAFSRIMISSLGFGGMHASVLLERVST